MKKRSTPIESPAIIRIKKQALIFEPLKLTVKSLSLAVLSMPHTRIILSDKLSCSEEALFMPDMKKVENVRLFADMNFDWPLELLDTLFDDSLFDSEKSDEDFLDNETQQINSLEELIDRLIVVNPYGVWYSEGIVSDITGLQNLIERARQNLYKQYPFDKNNIDGLLKQIEEQQLYALMKNDYSQRPIFVFSNGHEQHLIDALSQELTKSTPCVIDEQSSVYSSLNETLSTLPPRLLLFRFYNFMNNNDVTDILLSLFEGVASSDKDNDYWFENFEGQKTNILKRHICILSLTIPADFSCTALQSNSIGQELLSFARQQRLEGVELFNDMGMATRFFNLSNVNKPFVYGNISDETYYEYLILKYFEYYNIIFKRHGTPVTSYISLCHLAGLMILSKASQSLKDILAAMQCQLYDLLKALDAKTKDKSSLEILCLCDNVLDIPFNAVDADKIHAFYKVLFSKFRKNKQHLIYSIDCGVEAHHIIVTDYSIGQNLYTEDDRFLVSSSQIDFSHVVGLDDVKQRLNMIIDFLKNPAPYKKLRVNPATQLLLYGPPGCGKTLIAKAFAHHAGVPYYSLSAAEVTSQKYAGYGAILLRRIFETARQNAPSVIFLDEIDAFGNRNSFNDDSVGFDAKSIMNTLLVLLDGINSCDNIVVLAATNRIDDLDKALLRPKRFGTCLKIDGLSIKHKENLVRMTLLPDECAGNYDELVAYTISRISGDFSAALIENIIHEAKLKAVAEQRPYILKQDIGTVVDELILGKTASPISHEIKIQKSYHEAAYAYLHKLMFPEMMIEKISVQNRTESFGATIMDESSNGNDLYTEAELLKFMLIYMGAVAAEKKQCGKLSIGANVNFSITTKIASMLASAFDMGDGINNYVSQAMYELENGDYGFPEELRMLIKRLVETAYAIAEDLVEIHWQNINILATNLIQHENLDRENIQAVFTSFDMKTENINDFLARFLNIREGIGFKKNNMKLG